MADLLMLCPTRWRRKNLERFIGSFDATREADTDLLIIADTDDPSYSGMALPPYASMVYGKNECVAKKTNRHAVPGAQNYPAVGFMGDDITCETPGWDRLLLESMPGIAYPKNGRRDDVPESQIVDSKIIRALGWLHEPSMRHFWVDNVLAELGKANDCLYYRPDVECVHHHYHADKTTKRDRTYMASEIYVMRDEAAFKVWQRERYQTDCFTVRQALKLC